MQPDAFPRRLIVMAVKQADAIILSDVHIGSPMSRVDDLVRVLRSYSFNTLILNGDIFDNANVRRVQNDGWEFLSYIRELTGEEKEVIWVAGNHDFFAKNFFALLGARTCTEYTFTHLGKRCLVLHGDAYDRFLMRNGVVSGTMGASYRAFQRLGGKRQRISRFVKRRYKAWLRLSPRVAKGAVKHGLARNADVVICGHTHQAMEEKIHGVEYYNSGCWADRPSSLVVVDSSGIHIERFD